MTSHDEPLLSKPGCTDPHLGSALSRMLGAPLPPALAAHAQDCPACQLELHAFATLDDAAELSAGFISSLRRALESLTR
jgi:hypothetical protein